MFRAMKLQFAQIWHEHRRFLVAVGCGMTVFLALNSGASRYIRSADQTFREASQKGKQSRMLKNELKPYAEVAARLQLYEDFESRLRKEIELAQDLRRLDRKALLVQLTEKTEEVWAEARTIANQRGVALPEPLSEQDYGYETTDGHQEFIRYHSYLGVTRRALLALLNGGMRSVGPLELVFEELEPIHGDPSAALLTQTVHVEVSGNYQAFVSVLESVQEPGGVLRAKLLNVERPEDSDVLLNGEIEFSNLRLIELAGDTPRVRFEK